MVLWPIIQIDHQHGDVSKPHPYRFPPAHQAIDHTITRDFRGNPIQKQFILGRQEDADWGDRRVGVEVMIGRRRGDAALPASREWANFDRCFCVDGDP